VSDTKPEVTELLRAWNAGDLDARDRAMALVYRELRRRAAIHLRRERPGHTLQPTALVNEAYIRLVDQRDAVWQNRAQFLAVVSQMMRRILVDHARARLALNARDNGRGPLGDATVWRVVSRSTFWIWMPRAACRIRSPQESHCRTVLRSLLEIATC
jgi:RNA polymerase sigma factor (TIGR02999 family)